MAGLYTALSVFLLFSFTQASFAFPFFNQPSINPNSNSKTVCVDLSGSWKGYCIEQSGKHFTNELEMSQGGCESLKTKDVALVIGGSKSVVETYKTGEMLSYTLTSEWNKSGTALLLNQISLFKGEAPTQTGHFKASIYLKDKKLIVDVGYTDEKKSYRCEYDRH